MSKLLRNYVPALKYGAKILPNDLAGMLGLPYVGNIFYVDPTNGSDTANSGSEQTSALATVAAAFDKCTSGKHDVVIIAPTGGTGRTTETTAIDWNKRFTHLIGSSAPLVQDHRSGINFGTGGSITFSENGCLFQNLTFFSTADIDVTVTVTGDYNSFLGCDFKGTSNATSINSTPWRALLLTGAEENLFEGCTIGGDTYTRSAANASLELSTACARNVFSNCFFPVFTDDAAVEFVRADTAADVDRFVWFKDCTFHNAVLSSSTTMTIGMNVHAAVGGTFIMDGCSILGATDWANDYTAVYGCNMPDITAANAGFMEKLAT
jgi:hypothetical protein